MKDFAHNALRPGTRLVGDYEYTIERVLGAGGFGITYLASFKASFGNLTQSIKVAIKEHFMSDYCERGADATTVLGPTTGTIKESIANARRDFIGEARRLNELGKKHSNIVKVNEIFEANGTAYYVMEYLDGQSLWDYVNSRGPLNSAEIRSLLLPVVGAVAVLHANNFTHLDIKPSNIMLTGTADGLKPVLIDFGLSKHYDEHGNATSTVNTMAASDGFAPWEQYLGISSFRPKADVYALGATMLACATGQLPKRAGNWLPGEPQSIINRLPLDGQLRQVIATAMQHSDVHRFADASKMLTALTEPISDTNTTRRITPAPAPEPEKYFEPTRRLKPTPKVETVVQKAHNSKNPLKIGALIIALLIVCGLGIYGAKYYQTEGRIKARLSQTIPHNLDLAVRDINGNILYFNKNNWKRFQQLGDVKLGVVIDYDGERFILALDDVYGGTTMSWDAAHLHNPPTVAQGGAWRKQADDVADAIIAYEGRAPRAGQDINYWTNTQCNPSEAFALTFGIGYVAIFDKNRQFKVRRVMPIPLSTRSQ